jgi:hypothetical protein
LIAVYDWFEEHRCGLLADLKATEPDAPECVGELDDWRARSAPLILQHNLYGVDLSPESVEIAQLSLWIRTARPNQPLTDLSTNIRCGNSIVSDRALDPLAFQWASEFAAVFGRGGFDGVVGNPPYVRQERLSAIKPHLEASYEAYHGMADLYIYFYEKALRILKPGGRLAFVVTNKWMKSGYGEPLRKLFAEQAWVESVVDFGHAKQFFKDADVFPCFSVVRKPASEARPESVRACVIPRELIRLSDLTTQVRASHFLLPSADLDAAPWTLEPKQANVLLEKLQKGTKTLREYLGAAPLLGIKTGLNEAFVVDSATRSELTRKDPKAAEIIKPFLRGQDIKRWHAAWAGLWLIALKSSGDYPWPWAEAGEEAEGVFAASMPSVHAHLRSHRRALIERQDQGRYWWELRSCAYWEVFDRPKIYYQDITWRPSFSLDLDGRLSNNTVYLLPTADPWVLAIVNSAIGWWYAWRRAQHAKDEALRYFTSFMESFPIPLPSEEHRAACERAVRRLCDIARDIEGRRANLTDWLRVEHEIETPSKRLESLADMDSDEFVTEVQRVRRRRRSLTSGALRGLRDEYSLTIEPARAGDRGCRA